MMDVTQFLFPSYFVALMFSAAFQPRFNRVVIPTGLALVAVYPSNVLGGFVMLFFLPAILIAGFGSD
jgi:hypothetical protein